MIEIRERSRNAVLLSIDADTLEGADLHHADLTGAFLPVRLQLEGRQPPACGTIRCRSGRRRSLGGEPSGGRPDYRTSMDGQPSGCGSQGSQTVPGVSLFGSTRRGSEGCRPIRRFPGRCEIRQTYALAGRFRPASTRRISGRVRQVPYPLTPNLAACRSGIRSPRGASPGTPGGAPRAG